MSNVVPTGLKAGPNTTNTIGSNWYMLIYILLIWLSIFPEFFIIVQILSRFEISLTFFLLIFPLYLFFGYLLLVFASLFWAWVFLKITFLFHRPREGYFERSKENKDFRFWSLRAVIKKFPIWICHNFPIPWADTLAFKMFGNQVAFSTPTYDAWVDAEFLEIGHGTIIGQGSVIMTSMITTELLIIKRVKIGKNCLVGAHSVVSPGTVIGDNTVLGALSSTSFGQHLDSGWVYMGTPAIQYRESKFREKDDLTSEERAKHKPIKEVEEVISENEELKGRKTPIAFYQIKKQEYKGKRAQKHLEKAQTKREKAQKRLDKAEWRAEKHEFRAEKQQFQSLQALEIAKMALEKKIQKERSKLEKIEQQEKEKAQAEKKVKKENARIGGIKDKLFKKYEHHREEESANHDVKANGAHSTFKDSSPSVKKDHEEKEDHKVKEEDKAKEEAQVTEEQETKTDNEAQ